MKEISSAQTRGQKARRLWPVIVAVILFALLMSLWPELSAPWARALLAGCAFAVLGLGIRWVRR